MLSEFSRCKGERGIAEGDRGLGTNKMDPPAELTNYSTQYGGFQDLSTITFCPPQTAPIPRLTPGRVALIHVSDLGLSGHGGHTPVRPSIILTFGCSRFAECSR